MRQLLATVLTTVGVFAPILFMSLVTPAAGAQLKCSGVLTRSLGIEWEFSRVRTDLQESGKDLDIGDVLERQFNRSAAHEFDQSNFRKLYGFYGLDESGIWHRNLIARRFAGADLLQKLSRDYKVVLSPHPSGWIMENIDKISAAHFEEILVTLMHARGKFNADFKIRKNLEVWESTKEPLDSLIPNELAEEWRRDDWGNNRYVNFEFPMSGSTTHKSTLEAYVVHLLVRLGFVDRSDINDKEMMSILKGHIHWVPQISSLPSQGREAVYSAVVNHWGDRNDKMYVSGINVLSEAGKSGAAITISRSDYVTAANAIEKEFRDHYSIGILTRETFDRVHSHQDGITIDNRLSDLEPYVDTNIPPVFKRLPMGLRGSYGQPVVPDGNPIPIIGLEPRSHPTMHDNMRELPKDDAGQNTVDLQSLLQNIQPGKRGAISNSQKLKEAAQKLGLEPKILDDFNNTFPLEDRFKWPLEQMRAHAFLPLTDWLNHPVVRTNLNQMNYFQRIAATVRYKRALSHFIGRLNELAYARSHPEFHYKAPWISNKPEQYGGHNIVDPLHVEPALEDPKLGPFATKYKKVADDWFRTILQVEAVRFIAESNLQGLLASQ